MRELASIIFECTLVSELLLMEENHQHSISPGLILLGQFVEVIKKTEKKSFHVFIGRSPRKSY